MQIKEQMKNTIKTCITMLALGASALVVNASFVTVPNAANGNSLTEVLRHESINGDSYSPVSPRSQRWYSGSTENASLTRITTTVVPEPTTILAGALLLLPLAMSAVRILRRGKSDPMVA